MRLAGVLAVVVAISTLPALASIAEATDLRVHPGSMRALPAPPPARTPSVLKGPDPGLANYDRRDHDRAGHDRPGHGRPGHHRPIIVIPQTVYVSPGACWQPGYWGYQFVPQYTDSLGGWVDGQWVNGQWVAGHYVPTYSGYYQPVWVDGYYAAC